jgi:hypothetical protein
MGMRRMAWLAAGVSAVLAATAAAAPPAPGRAVAYTTPATAAPAADPVGKLIAEARQTYTQVRDYTAVFVKQERVGATLLAEQMAELRARTQPFSIHMKFTAPKDVAGREACFVFGKNHNRMRARGNGLLGAVGFVTLDLDDPKATKDNRHTLAEAGIGHLIERIAGCHAAGLRNPAGADVKLADYQFDGRPCTRVEVIHPRKHADAYAHRCVTYFDKETRLPVRFEAYDWPVAGGEPAGALLECYSYTKLRFNVGLADADFDK